MEGEREEERKDGREKGMREKEEERKGGRETGGREGGRKEGL